MQLLAACQKAPSVRRVVLKSTTAVYGASPLDPALFDETMTPNDLPTSGYAKDAAEIEGYLRGFARRRPDVSTTVLRFANLVGPRIDTVVTRYFALPVVPTVLGYDARVQLLHEEDALAVLERAVAARPARRRSTWPPTACSCSPRRSAGPGGCRCRCRRPPSASSGARSRSPGSPRLLPRAAAPARLRPGRRHHPAAHRVRLHPAVDHRAGLRRLRARARAAPDPRARAGGGGRTARRPRRARCRTAARRARKSAVTGDDRPPRRARRRPGRPAARRGAAGHAAAGPSTPRPARVPNRAGRLADRATSRSARCRSRLPRPSADRLRRRVRRARRRSAPARLGGRARRRARLPAPPPDRRLRRRRLRLRRRPHRQRHPPAAAAALPDVVPGRDHRPAPRAGRGRRAGRRQPLRHPAARRADDLGRAARRPPGAPAPADARRAT